MNNVYFACLDCKIMCEAGYRWAYWELDHPGIVTKGERIDLQQVLAATAYWNPGGRANDWLTETLSHARSFIEKHQSHALAYGEWESFHEADASAFDWLDESLTAPDRTPRFYFEKYGVRSWEELTRRASADQTWWWDFPKLRMEAKDWLEARLKSQSVT